MEKKDILEWVLDAELFKKFSSDKGQIPISDLLSERIRSSALNVEDMREYNCLIKFLNAILSGKSILCFNKEILKIYSTLIPKLPKELSMMLTEIISNNDLFKEVDAPLKLRDREPLMNTDLEKKIPYIAVAHFLHQRIIVSTSNDVEECYSKYRDKLILLQIDCKKVCDAWEEIKRHGS